MIITYTLYHLIIRWFDRDIDKILKKILKFRPKFPIFGSFFNFLLKIYLWSRPLKWILTTLHRGKVGSRSSKTSTFGADSYSFARNFKNIKKQTFAIFDKNGPKSAKIDKNRKNGQNGQNRQKCQKFQKIDFFQFGTNSTRISYLSL